MVRMCDMRKWRQQQTRAAIGKQNNVSAKAKLKQI